MKTALLLLTLTRLVPSALANPDPYGCNMPGSCSFACPASCARNVSRGTFEPLGGHDVKGTARIEDSADGLALVLDDDFHTVPGPDLRLVLRDSTGAMPMRIVAALVRTKGSQKFPVLLSGDELRGYDEVVVYCVKYHVDFGIAKLMRAND